MSTKGGYKPPVFVFILTPLCASIHGVGIKTKARNFLQAFVLKLVGVTRLATRQTGSASLTPFTFLLYGLHKVYPKAAEPLPFVFAPPPLCLQAIFVWVGTKTKARNFLQAFVLNFVGVTRFELATPRPPDVYSNRADNPDYLYISKLPFLVVDSMVDFVPC